MTVPILKLWQEAAKYKEDHQNCYIYLRHIKNRQNVYCWGGIFEQIYAAHLGFAEKLNPAQVEEKHEIS